MFKKDFIPVGNQAKFICLPCPGTREMEKICPAQTAVLPGWKIQTLQPKNFFLKLLFPHWTCVQAVRKHKESRGELAYDLKALLSQFLQELHSCQLSSGILEREALLPSRQGSLDGASWNTALSLPFCMENSRKAGKSISRTGKSAWNPLEVTAL